MLRSLILLLLIFLPSFNSAMAQADEEVVVIQTIMGESSKEPIEGQIAVGEVIRNRARIGGWWGSSAKEVCLFPYQFSFWNDESYAREWLRLYGDAGSWQRASRAWAESEFSDFVKGATHYCRFDSDAWWIPDMEMIVRIGDHVFYKEKK